MTRTGLIFIVLAFAAGGFIGYLGGTGSGDVVVSSGGKGSGLGPVAPAEPELLAMPRVPSGGFTSLEHALENIPYTPVDDGEGMFSGTVKTEDGEPIAGVIIRATRQPEQKPRPYRRGSGVPDEPGLEELVRKYVARVMEGRKNRREGATDENGRFVIAGVTACKHYLQAYREGYSFQSIGNSNYNVEPGAEVAFTGRPLSLLEIRMTLPDGTEPEKAVVVSPTPEGHMTHLPWFPEYRKIELAPGTHAIYATAGENEEYKSSNLTVEITLGVTPAPVHFELKARPGICGKVAMPSGENNSSANIYTLKLESSEKPDDEKLRSSGKSTWVHSHRPKYAFLDLQPGTWAVGLTFDQRTFVMIETVTVKDSVVELDLEPPEPRREDYILVRVLGPGGKALANVQFSAGYKAERRSGSGGTRVARMPDGAWRVWHRAVPKKEEGPVTFELTATVPQFGSKKVTYDRTPSSELTIEFEEAGTLEVTIAGYAGSGQEGKITLAVQSAQTGQRSRYQWFGRNGSQVDAEGKQIFTGLAPGSYEIVISLGRGRSQYSAAASIPIIVKSGRNSEMVNIPVLHTLTVLAPGAEEGARLSLRASGESSGRRFSSSATVTSGKAVFENVPAGEYELRGRSGSVSGSMNVSLPGQGVVRYEPVQQDCLRVQITGATGRLAAAGLLDGDLVVAIDGVELTDANQAMTLLRAAYVKPQAILSVLRGRGRKEVPVDLRPAGGEHGGRFAPDSR